MQYEVLNCDHVPGFENVKATLDFPWRLFLKWPNLALPPMRDTLERYHFKKLSILYYLLL